MILWGKKHTAIFQSGKSQVFSTCPYVYLSGYMQIGLKALTLVRAITLRSVVPLAMFPNLPSIAAQGVERSHWLRLFTFFLLFFFFFSTFSALLWIDSSLLKIRGYFVFLSQKIGSGILTQSFSSYFATMLGNRHLVIWYKKLNVQWMSPHKVVNELLFFYQRMTDT